MGQAEVAGSGYGSGYGDGSGSGSCAGYGDGDGDGYGDGDGDGYGDGSGSGDGDGDGYGYGDGAGSGDGDGYGYGYGDGAGDEKSPYWPSMLMQLSGLDQPPPAGRLAFWWSDSSGLPCNGGHSQTPVRVGEEDEIDEAPELCRRGFHASWKPWKWEGQRLWVVLLHGQIEGDAEKWVASKRTILAEVTDIHQSFRKEMPK